MRSRSEEAVFPLHIRLRQTAQIHLIKKAVVLDRIYDSSNFCFTFVRSSIAENQYVYMVHVHVQLRSFCYNIFIR